MEAIMWIGDADEWAEREMRVAQVVKKNKKQDK